MEGFVPGLDHRNGCNFTNMSLDTLLDVDVEALRCAACITLPLSTASTCSACLVALACKLQGGKDRGSLHYPLFQHVNDDGDFDGTIVIAGVLMNELRKLIARESHRCGGQHTVPPGQAHAPSCQTTSLLSSGALRLG